MQDQRATAWPELSEWVGRLSTEVHAVVDDIRRLVYGLRPPTLDDLGLHGAITEHVRQLSRSGATTIEMETTGDLSDLPAAVEVAAYRIVLEALTNMVRHSQASSCRVRLDAGADLIVSVTDDGVGLDGEPAGIGLQSMHRRAQEVGGSLTIGPSSSGTGTAVTAHLPLIDALVAAP